MITDAQLVQIVDANMAEAARRSGSWLLCGPGCTQCCLGPFEITPLDADRLRRGLIELDSERAARILDRVHLYMDKVGGRSLEQLLEEDFMDEEPCPVLDPSTGMCELYAYRPMTCRTFGPPAQAEDGSYSVCELCFEGASEKQIAAAWVDPDPDGLEAQLLEQATQPPTFVAAALAPR